MPSDQAMSRRKRRNTNYKDERQGRKNNQRSRQWHIIAEKTEKNNSVSTSCKWRTYIMEEELFSKKEITRLI